MLQEDQDWGIVAMVLDRLFLWMFGAAAVVGKIPLLLVILILKCRIKFSFIVKLTYVDNRTVILYFVCAESDRHEHNLFNKIKPGVGNFCLCTHLTAHTGRNENARLRL